MENEQIKKVNIVYLLAYIFCPLILLGVVSAILFTVAQLTGPASIVMTVLYLGTIAWWIYGGQYILKKSADKMAKELDEAGFTKNMTFNGKACVVVVDVAHGKIALVFRWNPGKHYVLPASRVTKAWVDDGKTGKGITEGSMRVGFAFIVDGVKIRVDTFTSNQKFKMTDNRILTGISKADSVVEAINAARGVR